MAGVLGSAFGWSSNPIYAALDQHRNALGNAFGGLATGLPSQAASGFVNGLNAGNIADLEQAKQAAELKKQQDQVNATLTYLQNKAPDLYQGVQAGVIDPNAAWMEAIKRSQPSAPQKPIEVNGQLVDPNTYKVLFDGRDPNSGQPNAPSGYRYNAVGALEAIPGGPADKAVAPKAPTEAQARAGGLLKVVSPDAALLLGDGTPNNPGVFEKLADSADQNKTGFGLPGFHPLTFAASPEYRQARDAVRSIAQSYLYATSGASAPDSEIQRISDSVTPQPFDSPAQVQDKKRRLASMVESIKSQAPSSGGANSVYTDPNSGVTIRQIP